ncbi:8-oxoguanine glycosylase ogg1 [Dissophora globulifera]|nr:8-oxoguanine glycosylase ogg1 [Dissophora globulifera]
MRAMKSGWVHRWSKWMLLRRLAKFFDVGRISRQTLSIVKETTSTPGSRKALTTTGSAIVTTTTTVSAVITADSRTSLNKTKTIGSIAPAHIRSTPWASTIVSRSELDLTTTLKCGQSFRWHREHQELPSGQISLPNWFCVLDHRLWWIRETADGFQYRTFRPSETSSQDSDSDSDKDGQVDSAQGQEQRQNMEKDRDYIADYFQLDVPLTELYAKWSEIDNNFRAKAVLFPGVRMLRQDPVENLICFICSANNNISRISQMVTKLCIEYGSPITVPAGELDTVARTFYGFPTIEALAQDGVEDTLTKLGFGYRARYIANSAKMIHAMDNGVEWLMGLRKLSHEDAHRALVTLQGVGPKVADCVCLMSLDKPNSIPVDTHVWQIAVRDYHFRFAGKVPKNISPAVYKAVGKHFVGIFGEYAGWANSVLFAADLRAIEGRVKIDPDSGLVTVKKEEETVEATTLLSGVAEQADVIIKQEQVKEEEEEESADVRLGVKEIQLDEDASGTATSRGLRQSKRRKGK